MGAPYTTVTVTGYNDNPPPDDGTESEENRILWETIKEKLPDPLKTAIEAVNTNVIAAFLKVIGGGGVTSSAINATIGASDQGKLYRASAGGITITTPDATSVTSPWVCGFVNNGSSAVTLDGNGSQTINGSASLTVPVNGGGLLFTDGSNWFIVGLGGVPAGKELMAGEIINGTISESNASNAVTFALKTLAGNDPSTDDPVLICFRNATAATGNYVYRTVTAALSLTINSTATMGALDGVAFDLVLALFDDGGTIRLGAINPALRGAQYYDLTQTPPIASSTTVGTGADSAKTWYTNGAGATSKAYAIIAIAKYSSGLVTAGTWNVSPTTLQLYGHGITLPGVAKIADTGLQLIYAQSASSSSTIDFNQTNSPSAFDGTYDRLVLVISRAKPATDEVEAWLRVGTGATPTYQTTNYTWASNGANHGSAWAQPGAAADAKIVMTRSAANADVGNAAGEHFCATIEIDEPDSGDPTLLNFRSVYTSSAAALSHFNGFGGYTPSTAVTAIRFLFESGNIASGAFALYGMRRS